jgi:2-amino-4-hydroxy-6-hydroxymethyldihydropteridine diphosphokinase
VSIHPFTLNPKPKRIYTIMRELVYLLLGSNVGDRKANIEKANTLITEEIALVVRSPYYETAAWGKTDQSAFLNLAISLHTRLEPLILLAKLKEIEKRVGRVDTEKWGPRVIDIDILFYGPQIIQEPYLQIPHPYLPVRRFALVPLADIAGAFVHPVLKKTIKELLADCPDTAEVRLYSRSV